jgi:hypothetical protein
VYVFHDLRPHLDPVVVRHLKEFALAERVGQTIVISGPDASVPHELEGVALPWTLEPPDRGEVEPLIRATIADLTQRGLAVVLTDDDVHQMVTACLGLTLPEIERLIIRQAIDDQTLDAADVGGIARARRSSSRTTASSNWFRRRATSTPSAGSTTSSAGSASVPVGSSRRPTTSVWSRPAAS